jgi:hypothetical protein
MASPLSLVPPDIRVEIAHRDMRDPQILPSSSAIRPHCPRCGATMSVLSVPAAGTERAPEASATNVEWYCSCCGVIVAGTTDAR